MNKNFCLLVTGSATESACHGLAIRFATAALDAGHIISKVFFYQAGCTIAFDSTEWPSDEPNWQQQWLALAQKYQFPLEICVAAAARRGLNEQNLAMLNDKESDQLKSDTAKTSVSKFEIVGLGQLAVTLSSETSQLIHFR